MYLKRKVYGKFLEWKRESSLTLEVSEVRQVGKTYIINKFADNEFQKKIYINMLAESGTVFLACLENARQWEPGQDRPEKPLQAALQLYDKSFIDDENTVAFLSEYSDKKAYPQPFVIRIFLPFMLRHARFPEKICG